MINSIISILFGLIFGVTYGYMFLGPFVKKDNAVGFDLKHAFGAFFRLVFITIAIIISIIYIDLNFVWILLGFMIAFWGTILGKLRAR
jgi:hypothetical protein